MDFANQKARKVGVFTDKTVAGLLPMKTAIESLEENGVQYEIFDKTRVEPNQQSYVQSPLLWLLYCVRTSQGRLGVARLLPVTEIGRTNLCETRRSLSQLGRSHRVRQEARLLALPRRRRWIRHWCVAPSRVVPRVERPPGARC